MSPTLRPLIKKLRLQNVSDTKEFKIDLKNKFFGNNKLLKGLKRIKTISSFWFQTKNSATKTNQIQWGTAQLKLAYLG